MSILLVLPLTLACWEGPLVGPLNEPAPDPQPFGGGGGGGGGQVDPDGGVDAGQGGGGGGVPVGMRFSEINATILGPSCATSQCHAGMPPPFAPMSLEPANAFASMVSRPSTQVPSMLRVAPGNPSQSYLMLKLQGGARAVGGTDSVMPLYAAPLDAAKITAVREWIARGAPND